MLESITARSILERLLENPFRMVGQPADATLTQVDDSAGALRRALKLNRPQVTNWDLPWMGPVTRSPAGIQTAMSRLVQPESRLAARVWWFCETGGLSDSASFESWQAAARSLSMRETPVAEHDTALAFLLACVVDDPHVHRGGWWAIALTQWDRMICSDRYWNYVMEVEARGGFEPPATTDDATTVRSATALVVVDVLSELANAARERNDAGCAVRILDLLAGAQATANVFSPSLRAKVLHLDTQIRDAWEDRLTKLCQDLNNRCLNSVHYERGFRDENRATCEALTQEFDSDVAPCLSPALAVLGESSSAARRVRETVAKCLLELAKAWTWADQWSRAKDLLDKGAALVDKDSAIMLDIERVMNTIGSEVKSERSNSKSSSSSPSSQDDLLAMLLNQDHEVIDKTPAGGSLWVVGGKKLEPLMKELGSAGFEFVFAEKGGRATGHRPAWYMRSKR